MILYKYINVEGALQAIENETVLLNMPSEYNDPLDCDIYISKKERREAYKLFLNYQYFLILYDHSVVKNETYVFGKCNTVLLKENLISIAKNVIRRKKYNYSSFVSFHYKLAKILAKTKPVDFSGLFNKMLDEVREKVKNTILLSCFSLKKDSILMWSHYGASHSVACLEFEVKEKEFERVHYSKKPVNFRISKVMEIIFGHELAKDKIDSNDESLRFALEPFLTKFRDWKYECEVRCGYSINVINSNIYKTMINGKTKRLLKMPGTLKSIYLGCKASDSFVDDVKKASKGIPLYKMEAVEGKYKLMPKKVC